MAMKNFNFDSNFFCKVLGVMALLVSAYFSWDDIQADRDFSKTLETPVYLMWTFFIQGALAMAGYQIFRQDGAKKIIAILVAAVAAYLSLQGTMAQRATRYQERVNSEITNDREYNNMLKEKARLIAKIDQYDLDIAAFTKQKLITVGVKPTKEDKKLAKQELEAVKHRLENYNHGSGSTAAAPYAFWAKFWIGEDASEKELRELSDSIKFWRDALLAILLDLGGAAMFAFASRPQRRREEDFDFNEDLTDKFEDDLIDLNDVKTAANGQAQGNAYSSHSHISNSLIPPEPKTEPKIEPENQDELKQSKTKKVKTASDDTPLSKLPRNRNGKIAAFNKSTLIEHIKNMFHNEGGPKDGHLRGQKRTAELYKAIHDVGGMAHKWLKSEDLIKVKGPYSYPKMSQSEMVDHVSKKHLH